MCMCQLKSDGFVVPHDIVKDGEMKALSMIPTEVRIHEPTLELHKQTPLTSNRTNWRHVSLKRATLRAARKPKISKLQQLQILIHQSASSLPRINDLLLWTRCSDASLAKPVLSECLLARFIILMSGLATTPMTMLRTILKIPPPSLRRWTKLMQRHPMRKAHLLVNQREDAFINFKQRREYASHDSIFASSELIYNQYLQCGLSHRL